MFHKFINKYSSTVRSVAPKTVGCYLSVPLTDFCREAFPLNLVQRSSTPKGDSRRDLFRSRTYQADSNDLQNHTDSASKRIQPSLQWRLTGEGLPLCLFNLKS
eukprot:TRINITY_DN44581_c1_g1_i2.p1 TRINITY_DN44581_c1_g1~~TRINITY_DN44581_c1_g1_i2.p1  ORF type:complete len:103 (+),score=11.17 TRINITY_DN44581_c1_g1_i2:3-311(+)